jgi:hypothetical protein
LKDIDYRVQAQVKGLHAHNILMGDIGTLLEIPLDDDRIAACVGHEVSHCILRHISEQRGDSLITELCRYAARCARDATFFTSCASLPAVSPFCLFSSFLFFQAATYGQILPLNGSV